MRVRVVRTAGRLSVCTDAGTIEPWLDVTALPDSLTRAFGFALSRVILALRVLRPIQRKAVTHEPLAEIRAVDRTCCDRAPVLIEIERHAVHRAHGNEGIKTSPGRGTSRGEIGDPLLSGADRFYRGGSLFSAKSSPISIRRSLSLERTLRHL
jgi:hypothetical protein